jgi:hypothetical protein
LGRISKKAFHCQEHGLPVLLLIEDGQWHVRGVPAPPDDEATIMTDQDA